MLNHLLVDICLEVSQRVDKRIFLVDGEHWRVLFVARHTIQNRIVHAGDDIPDIFLETAAILRCENASHYVIDELFTVNDMILGSQKETVVVVIDYILEGIQLEHQ